MNKVICDICGTQYPETAQQCPICGGSPDPEEEVCLPEEADSQEKIGLFAAGILAGGLDFGEESFEDAVVREPKQEDLEEDEEIHQGNPLFVVLLVVLITLLLAASGYLFLRYFLPNMLVPQPTTADTAPAPSTDTTASTNQQTIPCESLVLTGGVDPITMEGGYRLLHVRVSPANTTDKLVFASEDESVVIVNDDGRMTAMGEGETHINITCGQQKLRCHVTVDYSLAEPTQPPETIPPMTTSPETESTEDPEKETDDTAQSTGETRVEETGLKDVVLKLKKTDISLGVGLTYTLPLDCDLSYEEIEWSVEEPHVVKVENGRVTALRKGVTDVVARYGDQVVECRIRCT